MADAPKLVRVDEATFEVRLRPAAEADGSSTVDPSSDLWERSMDPRRAPRVPPADVVDAPVTPAAFCRRAFPPATWSLNPVNPEPSACFFFVFSNENNQ